MKVTACPGRGFAGLNVKPAFGGVGAAAAATPTCASGAVDACQTPRPDEPMTTLEPSAGKTMALTGTFGRPVPWRCQVCPASPER